MGQLAIVCPHYDATYSFSHIMMECHNYKEQRHEKGTHAV